MRPVARLLEGEPYLYRGVLYLAKGYQHPVGLVIAYPKYTAIKRSKLGDHEKLVYSSTVYWDCIKQGVTTVPLDAAYTCVNYAVSPRVLYIKSLLGPLLEAELHLTGSAMISESFNDVDFVVYGASDVVVEKLRAIFDRGILDRPVSLLIEEYSKKHRGRLRLEEYLYLKKNTILHCSFKGIHINFKLVELSRGYEGCIEPVEDYSYYSGPVEVVNALNPHRIPARYKAFAGGQEVVIESLRELYAELPAGRYYAIDSRIEKRKSGLYLVPDHGVLRPFV
ncbi:MAG: hypothetical protein QXH02_04385 [Desulfurococcaceae archaeon]